MIYPQTIDSVLDNIETLAYSDHEEIAMGRVLAYIKWIRSEEMNSWEKRFLKKAFEVLNDE